MKRRYTGEGKSGEGSFFALSLLGCPLCFSSIPWKRLMVFFWEAGGSPPLYRLSGSRPFGLLSFPRLPSSSLFRLHSITRVIPPLLPLSLHQNSTSTRNDCIVDVDTNNVSGTVDKTALLFLLSARSSFPFTWTRIAGCAAWPRIGGAEKRASFCETHRSGGIDPW